MKFSLRRAQWEDLECLDKLYTDNMHPLVERVAVWDLHRFRRNFDPQEFSVIEIAGYPAGLVKIVMHAEDITIAEIQIREIYRGRGIGKKLIQDAIALSEGTGKRLRLRVVKGNLARAFYERYGFTCFHETDTYDLMERVAVRQICAEQSPVARL